MADDSAAQSGRFGQDSRRLPLARAYSCRLALVPMFFFLCATHGCHSPTTPSQAVSGFFSVHERPDDCSAHCCGEATCLVRAELGLDPVTEPSARGTQKELFNLFRQYGARVACLDPMTVLENLSEGPTAPAFFLHENGHIYALIGSIAVEGKLMCQFVHGTKSPSLTPKMEVLRAGFKQAWRVHAPSRAVPIKVGTGSLRIDRVFHNFGETKHGQRLACNFSLSNVSAQTITLGRSLTSCSCTMTSPLEGIEIPPGQSFTFSVHVDANSASLRQSTILTFLQQPTGTRRRVELLFFGSRAESMSVTPSVLDFGQVTPGRASYQTVSVRETSTDRFCVRSVTAANLPLTATIDNSRDEKGLHTFRIRVRLEVPDQESGKHSGRLMVLTDSHVHSGLSIPITYEVAPLVRIVPDVLSLGTIELGESREARIHFIQRASQAPVVEVDRLPAQCTARVEHSDASPELVVTTRLDRPGIWTDSIRCRVRLESRTEMVEIKCVAFGRTGS